MAEAALPTLSDGEQAHLELILRGYPLDCATIRVAETVTLPGHPLEVVRYRQQGTLAKPTERAAAALEGNTSYQWARWRVSEIRRVYDRLDVLGRDVVAWAYWAAHPLGWRPLADRLHWSERTILRRRLGVLTAFALQLPESWRDPLQWWGDVVWDPDSPPPLVGGDGSFAGPTLVSEPR